MMLGLWRYILWVLILGEKRWLTGNFTTWVVGIGGGVDSGGGGGERESLILGEKRWLTWQGSFTTWHGGATTGSEICETFYEQFLGLKEIFDHSFWHINQHWLSHSSFNWFIKSKATGDCLIVMNLQAALEIGNFTDCDATLLTQSSSCQQVRQRRDNADLALKMMVAMAMLLREFTSPQYSGCHSQSRPCRPCVLPLARPCCGLKDSFTSGQEWARDTPAARGTITSV